MARDIKLDGSRLEEIPPIQIRQRVGAVRTEWWRGSSRGCYTRFRIHDLATTNTEKEWFENFGHSQAPVPSPYQASDAVWSTRVDVIRKNQRTR